jgi:septal ring factor EnvC (AmiA/AmiB activator)
VRGVRSDLVEIRRELGDQIGAVFAQLGEIRTDIETDRHAIWELQTFRSEVEKKESDVEQQERDEADAEERRSEKRLRVALAVGLPALGAVGEWVVHHFPWLAKLLHVTGS